MSAVAHVTMVGCPMFKSLVGLQGLRSATIISCEKFDNVSQLERCGFVKLRSLAGLYDVSALRLVPRVEIEVWLWQPAAGWLGAHNYFVLTCLTC